MTKQWNHLWVGVACAGLLLSAGCIGLKQKNPGIGTYMLESVRDGAPATTPAGTKLIVDVVEVLPPYDVQTLIIRDDDVSFESSYYNRLILSPSENFRNNLYYWFSDSGLFKEVVLDERTGATHRLGATVLSFYGDRAAEEAVLRMKISLVDYRQRNHRTVLCSHTYAQRTSVDEFTVEALIRAYNEALASVLRSCEADVADALNRQQLQREGE